MGSDLIITGKYGVLNQQRLLNSTSNNINNVNTEGYIRKETQTYTSVVNWGVGETYTRRVYDQFVQRQMYTDCGDYNYYKAYGEGLVTVDNILSDDSMSVANSLTGFFDELSTAADLPTSSANRDAAIAKLQLAVERFNYANDSMYEQLEDVNGKIDDTVTNINTYTQAIAEINYEIRALSLTDNIVNKDIYMQMLDERDRLVGELSEEVNVKVVEQSDGTYEVYLNSGMLLANGDSYARLDANINVYDSTKRDIYLGYGAISDAGHDQSYVQLTIDNLGGALGGYLNSTKEIRNAMRELGKLAVAFADALNEQNKAGFTLEDVAGADLLSYEEVKAVSSNSAYAMTASFIEGKCSNVQAYDFELKKTSSGVSIYRLGADEQRELIQTIASTDTEMSGNTITLDDYGIKMTFGTNLSAIADNTTFKVQPTLMSASRLEVAISKPEDFAFASAVRTKTTSNNYGNATISLVSCTHTGTDYGVYVGTDNKPAFNTTAPTKIKIDEDGNYNIYSAAGKLVAQAPASTKGVNLFANAYQASADSAGNITVTTTPYDSAETGYPGYEVSVTGTVKENDSFTIEINKSGQADNSNANALVALRSSKITRTSGSTSTSTLNEGYANMVAQTGAAVSSAASNEEATKAKYDQTTLLYESVAGINLDEEATNLLMYQQSYQACAKIIEASQTIFNALISSM